MEKEDSFNPITRRLCLKICGSLASPLLAGSGEDNQTDCDVILDGWGCPYLPGSSLAGAMRQYLVGNVGREAADSLFGKRRERGNARLTALDRQSRLYVYDVELAAPQVVRRDGIRLDEYKTTENKAKYDMQAVERGTEFTLRLELLERERDDGSNDEVWLETLLQGLASGELTVGAKSRRGFGRLHIDQIKRKEFHMKQEAEHRAWLEWDWKQPDAFSEAEEWRLSSKTCYHKLCVPLEIRTTLLIRDYGSVEFGKAGLPDTVQLCSNHTPVISGTSWMGAIRGRIAEIIRELYPDKSWGGECQRLLDPVFGTWKPGREEKITASAVRVEESLVEGGAPLSVSRTAIDRFTGGTVPGALYTEQVWVKGTTELTLRWPVRRNDWEAICGMLLWAVSDLQAGLLAVGGETAVGRGCFDSPKGNGKEMTLDGQPVTDKRRYFKAAAEWLRKNAEKEGQK